jgi:hypothetical protein
MPEHGVWTERGGFLFAYAGCGQQTSLTSGTRAGEDAQTAQDVDQGGIPDSARAAPGISAKDLQRIIGCLLQDGGSTSFAPRWCVPTPSRLALSSR